MRTGVSSDLMSSRSCGGGGLVWRWRFLLLTAGVVAAGAGTVLAISVNVLTGGTARPLPWIERQPLGWTAGATAVVAGAALLMLWAQRLHEHGLAVLVPATQRPETWVVDRPAEV